MDKKCLLTFYTKSKIKNIIFLILELHLTDQSEIISEMYLEMSEVQVYDFIFLIFDNTFTFCKHFRIPTKGYRSNFACLKNKYKKKNWKLKIWNILKTL